MAEQPFVLLLRHASYQTNFYNSVLAWISEHAPECIANFRLGTLPMDIKPEWDLRCVVMWLQDPVETWSQPTYYFAEGIASYCDQVGVPVINRPSRTSNAIKSVAAPLIASAGFRVPKMSRVTDFKMFCANPQGVGFPFFVREDHGHGSQMIRADSTEEALGIPIETFTVPLGVEFIDVADPSDGLFRKYRYMACGVMGISQHMQASKTWITRGEQRVLNERTRAEELRYIEQPDPNHARFQAAMRALGLDVAAFDYSYDHDGNVVVWEVNPFPHIELGKKGTSYRNRAIHRSIASMVATYLGQGRLPIPESVMSWVRY